MAKSYLNNAKLPRGIRNNNPGNLIITGIDWNGEVAAAKNTDGHFEQFIELRYGIRALMRDIISDVKRGNNTITGLIHEFAPAIENNTAAYINTITSALGIPANIAIELTQESLIALCKVIVRVENGSTATTYVTDQDYKDAIAILGYDLKKKQAR
jgi:hypothetical protein